MNISDERSVNSKQASCGVYCVTGSSRKVKDLGCLLCYDQLSTITSRSIIKLVLSCRFTAPYQYLFSSIKLAKLCSSGQEPSKNHQVKVPKKNFIFFCSRRQNRWDPSFVNAGEIFLLSSRSTLSSLFSSRFYSAPHPQCGDNQGCGLSKVLPSGCLDDGCQVTTCPLHSR